MKHVAGLGLSLFALVSLVACGDTSNPSTTTSTTTGSGGNAGTTGSGGGTGGTGGAGTTTSAGTGGSTSGTGGAGTTTGTGTGGSATTSTSGSGTGGAGGAMVLADPDLDGPYTFKEIDDSMVVAATGHNVPVHCAYPTAGPSAGPYPVVLVSHGFQLPPTQYLGYVKRLASFGYVAVSVDFPAPFFGEKHTDNAKDVVAGLDWAKNKAELAGKADVNNAGATGHSLGGKVSLLVATMEPRIKASITLDPVDTSMNCAAADCPDVSALMPNLHIPTGFVGETIDAAGGFQPCAPAADNFTTFYAGANSPSLSVTVKGANHMSFLDNVAICGLTCSFCNMATAPNAQVNGLAKAYVVAFYERYLRGIVGYDTYLTGADAQARYVATGQATIVSK
jgi:dienelactone hydrolase